MEGSSVLFSVDWETFVCSGDDARTCYENLCDGYTYIYICIHTKFLYLFLFLFLFCV